MGTFSFAGLESFPQFALGKSFSEFSGNPSALILLLEYPGKTDGAAAGNLREPVLDRLFCFCQSETSVVGSLASSPARVARYPHQMRNCSLSKVVEESTWLRSTRAGGDAWRSQDRGR